MSIATASPSTTAASFPCPNCGKILRSPHHTICPVCAEPISPEYIRSKVGDDLFKKAWRVPGGNSGMNPVVIGLIATLVVLGIVLLVIWRASGG